MAMFHVVLLTEYICLTAKLLKQGYRYHKLRNASFKFYRRHNELISKFNVGLKSLLHQGLSEPEFYGDLVYKGLGSIRPIFGLTISENITVCIIFEFLLTL